MSSEQKVDSAPTQLQPLPAYLDVRATFANSYLIGEGIEIGPLHQPLAIPPHARVRYVDRMSTADLRAEYPELADWDLTEPDIVDDGELLTSIPSQSLDFIVANHFLEHTENPIGTIETHLSKLRPGGVLFYAVPDKQFTFDFRREVTPLEHMLADYDEGPERSRSQHYDEWATLSEARAEGASKEQLLEHARELEAASYSIHMHVWTQVEFVRLLIAIRDRLDRCFELEAAARNGIEFIVVLRKQGPLPQPPVVEQPRQSAPLRAARRVAGGVKRCLVRGRDELRRRRRARD